MGNRRVGAWLAAAVCGGLILGPGGFPAEAAALTRAWSRTYDGPAGGGDEGHAVAIGPRQAIYACGSTDVVGEGANALLVKYDAAGARRWVRTYNGDGNDFDGCSGVAVAPDGSIYAAGWTKSTPTGGAFNILLLKYSPGGARAWARVLDLGDDLEGGNAVAIAPGGSVYVAGKTGSSMFLQKFTAGGDPLWTRTLDGIGRGVATDGDEFVYAVGDHLLMKYSADGDEVWSQPVAVDGGAGVAVAPDHTVAVVGSLMSAGHASIMLRTYRADGELLWQRLTMGGVGYYGSSFGSGVAVGSDGRIAVIGTAGPPEDASEQGYIHLRVYSADGRKLGAASHNGNRGSDAGLGIAVGRDGALVGTGVLAAGARGPDLWVGRYR
jgi:hypothetical protein